MIDSESRVREAFASIELPSHLNEETLAAIEAKRAALQSGDGLAGGEAVLGCSGVREHGATACAAGAVRPVTKKRAAWKPVLAAAACLLLAAIGVYAAGFGQVLDGPGMVNVVDDGQVRTQEPEQGAANLDAATPSEQVTAYLTVDVNPSIEFALDRNDVVLEAVGLNEDGVAVLDEAASSGTDFVGMPAADALATLTSSLGYASYLSADAYVALAVASEDANQQQRVLAAGQQCLNDLPCQGSCDAATLAERDRAIEAGMGIQRYRAAQELMALDSSVTLDDCCCMSMRELRDRIAAASGGEYDIKEAQGLYGQGAHAGQGAQSGQGNHGGNGAHRSHS